MKPKISIAYIYNSKQSNNITTALAPNRRGRRNNNRQVVVSVHF